MKRRYITFETLELRNMMSVTPSEQYMVYILNEARHDPVAYQHEQNLSVDLSYVAPRPPLAINNQLFSSALVHANDMAQNNYFGHYSPYLNEWPNKMVRDQGYALPTLLPVPGQPNSYWPISDDSNQVESIAGGYSTAYSALNALIVDQGESPPGHRIHLLGIGAFTGLNREIGVAHVYDATSTYKDYWAIHATLSNETTSFATGVVFNDANHNNRFDQSEGVAGLTITTGRYSTSTNEAGGWSMPLSPGTYQIHVGGNGFDLTTSATVGSDNVEVDFTQNKAFVDFAETSIVTTTPAYQNPLNNYDVNHDGRVTPTDALLIINSLLSEGSHTPTGPVKNYLDVNGDNYIAPADALIVINQLLNSTIPTSQQKVAAATDVAIQFFAEPEENNGSHWEDQIFPNLLMEDRRK